ncbi:hypothetical protein PROFUN_09021 [Planoprotostelium fungivorum]|uniref:HMG box domain-containing protein n=1 Tax=Planoprotostelium fungivorum TaxID=1890364 RepID=A0A2P6MUZ8_9EUKA|nr:hypothetical protein PROFUN_09021 [Planoprotostelium fungivorum]
MNKGNQPAPPAMEYGYIAARYFALKVGTITNSRRIIVITTKKPFRFLAFNDSDQVQENHPVNDISNIALNPMKEHEFTISWEGGTKETYVCDQKEGFLSELWRQYEEEKGLLFADDTPRYAVTERTNSKESRTTTLTVGLTTINKMQDHDVKCVRSFKWIADITRIIKFEKNEDHRVEIQFKDGSYNDYILPEKERPTFLAHVRNSMKTSLQREVVVEEGLYEKVMRERNQREQLHDVSSSILLECVVHQLSHRPDVKPKQRVLSLTHSHILVGFYDPDNHVNINYNKARATTKGKTAFSARAVENVIRLRMNYDTEQSDRFIIDFSTGKSIEFSSPQREVIMSTIVEIARWKGHNSISILFTPYLYVESGYKVGSLSNQEFKMENINYFMRRVLALTPKTDETEIMFILSEFIHNIPLADAQIKDRKLIHNLFALLKWKMSREEATSENRKFIILSTLTAMLRTIGFKGSADEVYREKDKLSLLISLLKSSEHSISVAVAKVIQGVVLTTTPQNPKSELYIKDFLFTDENIAGLMALLLRNVEERICAMLISTLISIFESAAVSTTTSKELKARLTARFLNHMEMLFGLCRYQCIPIVKSASAIMVVLLNSIKSDEKNLHKNQDLARSSTALIWQLTLVFDSLAREQQSLSRSLVELMVEGNEQSINLFKKIFPLDIMRLLFPPPPVLLKGQKPPKVYVSLRSSTVRVPVIIGGEGNPTNTEKWNQFFNRLSENIEVPNLIWDENLRQELIFCINEEIAAYDYEKEHGPKGRKYAWNFQEFSVPYNCLATEMKVGPLYINLIVHGLPDVEVNVRDPLDFIQRLFYRFLIETVTEHKVACLKTLTWLYANYAKQIGSVNFIENLLYILDTKPNREITGNILLFLREALTLNQSNLNTFISLGGPVTFMKLLPFVHLKRSNNFVMSFAPINPHIIGVICQEILMEVSKTQSNMDEQGNFKSPIALLKRQISIDPYLQHLVQCLITGGKSGKPTQVMVKVSKLTVDLLEYVIQFNDAVGFTLYKTGLFYFLMRYQHLNPLPIAQLISKLHRSQTISPGVSILRKLIPGFLVDLMERETVEMYVEAFNGKRESPREYYWTQLTRDYLNEKLDQHLSTFMEKLNSSMGKAVYEFEDIETIEYPPMEHFEDIAEKRRLEEMTQKPHLMIGSQASPENNRLMKEEAERKAEALKREAGEKEKKEEEKKVEPVTHETVEGGEKKEREIEEKKEEVEEKEEEKEEEKKEEKREEKKEEEKKVEEKKENRPLVKSPVMVEEPAEDVQEPRSDEEDKREEGREERLIVSPVVQVRKEKMKLGKEYESERSEPEDVPRYTSTPHKNRSTERRDNRDKRISSEDESENDRSTFRREEGMTSPEMYRSGREFSEHSTESSRRVAPRPTLSSTNSRRTFAPKNRDDDAFYYSSGTESFERKRQDRSQQVEKMDRNRVREEEEVQVDRIRRLEENERMRREEETREKRRAEEKYGRERREGHRDDERERRYRSEEDRYDEERRYGEERRTGEERRYEERRHEERGYSSERGYNDERRGREERGREERGREDIRGGREDIRGREERRYGDEEYRLSPGRREEERREGKRRERYEGREVSEDEGRDMQGRGMIEGRDTREREERESSQGRERRDPRGRETVEERGRDIIPDERRGRDIRYEREGGQKRETIEKREKGGLAVLGLVSARREGSDREEEKIDKTEREAEEMEGQKREIERRREEMEREREEVERGREAAERQRRELEVMMGEMAREKQEIDKRREEEEREREEMERKRESVQKEIEEMERQREEMERKRGEMEKIMQDMERNRGETETEGADEREEERGEKEEEEERGDKKEEEEEIERKRIEVERERRETEEKKEMVEKQREEVEKERLEMEREREEMERRREEMEEQREEMERKRREMEEETERTKKQIEILEEERKREEEMQKDEEKRRAEEERAEMERAREEIEKKRGEVEKEQEEIAEEKREIEQTREQMSEDRREIEEKRDELEKTRGLIEKEKEDIAKEREAMEREREEREKTVGERGDSEIEGRTTDERQKELEERQKELEEREEKMEEEKRRAEQMEIQLKEEKERVEEEKKAMEEEMKRTEEERRREREEMEEEQRRMKEETERIDQYKREVEEERKTIQEERKRIEEERERIEEERERIEEERERIEEERQRMLKTTEEEGEGREEILTNEKSQVREFNPEMKIEPWDDAEVEETRTHESMSSIKDVNRPKRPTTAFTIFSQDKRPELKERHPELMMAELTAKTAEEWETITPMEKQKYIDREEKETVEYEESVKAFEEGRVAAAANSEQRLEEERDMDAMREDRRRIEERQRVEENERMMTMMEEERQRVEEEKKGVEEEKRKTQDERGRIEEEKRRTEEARERIEEEKRKTEEERERIEEEKRRTEEEMKRIEEEKKETERERERIEEEKREMKEEKRKTEEERDRIEEERRRIEEQSEKIQGETRRIEEESTRVVEERERMERERREMEEEKARVQMDKIQIQEEMKRMEEERHRIEEEKHRIEEERRTMEEERKGMEEEKEKGEQLEEKGIIEGEEERMEEEKEKGEQLEEKGIIEGKEERMEEERHIEEERRRVEDDRIRVEEEKMKTEEERERIEEEKRRIEEQSEKVQGEARRIEEESTRVEEERKRLEEERQRLEEERGRLKEEKERLDENRRREEEMRSDREKREDGESTQEREKEEAEVHKRMEEEKSRLEEEKRRLEEEKRHLEEEERTIEEEKMRAKELIDQMEGEKKRMEEERSKVEEERSKVEEERIQVEEEKKRMEEEKKITEEEKRQMEETRRELEERDEKIRELQRSLEDIRSQMMTREEGTVEDQFNQLERQRDEMNREMSSERKKIEEEREALRLQLQEIQRERSKIEEEKEMTDVALVESSEREHEEVTSTQLDEEKQKLSREYEARLEQEREKIRESVLEQEAEKRDQLIIAERAKLDQYHSLMMMEADKQLREEREKNKKDMERMRRELERKIRREIEAEQKGIGAIFGFR